METLVYLLALPIAMLAMYIAAKKTTRLNAVVLFGIPIIVNTVDVFVSGNLTIFREIAFATWSFLSLYVAFNKKTTK